MTSKGILLLIKLLLCIVVIPFSAEAAPAGASILTLTEAINTALANNQTIIQANLVVDLASARYQETQSAFKPQLTISETAGRQQADRYQTRAYDFTHTVKKSRYQRNATKQLRHQTFPTTTTIYGSPSRSQQGASYPSHRTKQS